MRTPLPRRPPTSPTPRIIVYHQTHYHNGVFVSALPLLTENTGITHLIIAAIHINAPDNHITLNDEPYTSPKLLPLWNEVRTFQRAGVRVLGMLGGAAPGTYVALDGHRASFAATYAPLRAMLQHTGLDGLDLDVEESMSVGGVIRLIDALGADFGPRFLITMAPVATAMQGQQNLSGFDYETVEKAVGHRIGWFNTQFYCGWGSVEGVEEYEKIVGRGWEPEKVVVGVVTNPGNGKGWVTDEVLRKTLRALVERHPGFGGVMGWEYFNSITTDTPEGKPWCWAKLMHEILTERVEDTKLVRSGAEEM